MHELTVFCGMFQGVTPEKDIFNNPRRAQKKLICVKCKKS